MLVSFHSHLSPPHGFDTFDTSLQTLYHQVECAFLHIHLNCLYRACDSLLKIQDILFFMLSKLPLTSVISNDKGVLDFASLVHRVETVLDYAFFDNEFPPGLILDTPVVKVDEEIESEKKKKLPSAVHYDPLVRA